ncbi:MAG: sulfotransferase domain-containing protein [Candidatus Heimdallarchaeaceae archaeon]
MHRVFVNSIPKSGTNLVIRCLTLFGFKENGHLGSTYVVGTKPIDRINRIISWPIRQGYIVGIIMPIEMNKTRVNRKLRKVKEGELISGHIGYTPHILKKALDMSFKVIHIIRDPRAVLTSSVPFILKRKRHPLHKLFKHLTLEQCYRTYYEGYFGKKIFLQPLYIQYQAIEPWTESKDVLVVRFEDLVGSKGGGDSIIQYRTVKQICNHVNADEDKIDSVLENLFSLRSRTFRKGKVDSWKEELPLELQKEIKEKLKDTLVKWSYY